MRLFIIVCLILVTMPHNASSSKIRIFNKDDNGIWMRRTWIHGQPSKADIIALVKGLRDRGIKRIYPFLGPMNKDGWPGWRSKKGLVLYVPENAGAFFREFKKHAPEIKIMPWTGGILKHDVRLLDEKQRKKFASHMKRIVDLGADGVHLNIEPLPSWSKGFLLLLKEVKEAIGNKTLSIAAYPPPTELHPYPSVHWELKFMKAVCMAADELAVMAYDTAVTKPKIFEKLISQWTTELMQTLPSPAKGGCEWLMGVSAYDDDTGYHRPDVETVEHTLNGINAALRRLAGLQQVTKHFRGVAIYASFTTDEKKWATYDRLWRGIKPVTTSTPPDFQAKK